MVSTSFWTIPVKKSSSIFPPTVTHDSLLESDVYILRRPSHHSPPTSTPRIIYFHAILPSTSRDNFRVWLHGFFRRPPAVHPPRSCRGGGRCPSEGSQGNGNGFAQPLPQRARRGGPERVDSDRCGHWGAGGETRRVMEIEGRRREDLGRERSSLIPFPWARVLPKVLSALFVCATAPSS